MRRLRELGREGDAEALERGLYGATSGEALALIAAAARGILRRRRGLPPEVADLLAGLRKEAGAALRKGR